MSCLQTAYVVVSCWKWMFCSKDCPARGNLLLFRTAHALEQVCLILGLTLGGHCWHKPKSYPLTYTFSAINLTFKSLHDILSLKCQEGKMSVTLWVLHNKDYCRLFQRKHETETKFLSNFRFYLNHGNSIENGQCLITRQYINICLAYLKGLLS